MARILESKDAVRYHNIFTFCVGRFNEGSPGLSCLTHNDSFPMILATKREFLSTSLIISSNSTSGKKELDFSLAINSEAITAITRVDALGKIIYTTPDDAAVIGRESLRLEYFMK